MESVARIDLDQGGHVKSSVGRDATNGLAEQKRAKFGESRENEIKSNG